jgi:hypothetical protein
VTPYYSDDLVTLYHGDCREVTDWLAADVLVTDPPYGIAWPAGRLHSERRDRDAATQSIVGDESTGVRDEALAMWSGPAVIFGTWRRPLVDLEPSHRLIWHKQGRHPGVSPHPWYATDEEIWLLGTGWVGKPTPTVLTTTEQRAAEPSRIGHPTPKPLGLMERLIEKCPPGVIADPFAGSGSTLVAARNLGRTSVGVELDESYCELIAKRLAQDVLDFEGATA